MNNPGVAVAVSSESIDGRAARWEEHNAARRRSLVKTTLKAIRRHGPGVGIDQIANEAGTSKTVLYRHFGGRTGLYQAVVDSVHRVVTANLTGLFANPAQLEPARLVRELTNAYLALVEKDSEIYQFVVSRPLGDQVEDPITGITGQIGNEVAEAFRTWLVANGLDPNPANTWGHGVVGFVWATADKWITTGLRRPRAEIVEFTARLFDPAFSNQ